MVQDLIGNHAFYKKLAFGISAYTIGSTYALFALVEYVWLGAVWPLAPKVMAYVAAGIAVFAVAVYVTFLQFDGHFLTEKDAAKNAERRIIPFP